MRFYVQDPHVDGLAVIDRERSTMIISSFGDVQNDARAGLWSVARALNAATDPNYTDAMGRADIFRAVHPNLQWRVIKYLAEEILRCE